MSSASPTPPATSATTARLYDLSRADAACILHTFPIVHRHHRAAFGHDRTKDMALAAGDTDVDVAA